MRDYQEAEVAFFLEGHQFHHEDAGIDALVCGIAEVGEVVDDDDFCTGAFGGCFYIPDDGFFVALGSNGVGVDFGSEEAVGEDVTLVGVAELELFVGEFAVHVEDVAGLRDFVGHLNGVYGFAEVGVGK